MSRETRGPRGWARLLGASMLLLAGCADREDEVPEVEQPLSFAVTGTLCDEAVNYEAPADSVLRLLTTPSGLLAGLVVSDGGLVKVNDSDARDVYAGNHDLFAFVSLEEPTQLRTGSLGWVAAAQVMARGFGSAELSGINQRELEITAYESGLVAGSFSDRIDWFTKNYPELGRDGCQEGDLSLSFRGPFELWGGQDECFSPTRNLDELAHDFVVGCACDADVDAAQCVTVCDDPSEESGLDASCDGIAIALFCSGEQWSWGHDGPCQPAD